MKNLLERFNRRVGFTRNESLVVLFLVGTLLAGGAIKLTQKLTGIENPQHDYSALDQEFAARSVHHAAAFEENQGETQRANKTSEAKKSAASSTQKLKSAPAEKININVATKDELMRIPGIGEVTAERIIMYREDHGPFRTVDDLLAVKGIGKKKLERIAPYITTQ